MASSGPKTANMKNNKGPMSPRDPRLPLDHGAGAIVNPNYAHVTLEDAIALQRNYEVMLARPLVPAHTPAEVRELLTSLASLYREGLSDGERQVVRRAIRARREECYGA